MEYLESIHLINIQSWKDFKVNLTEGINVFEADSETGKSVPFKVLRQMCFPSFFDRKERKSLIRRGCEVGIAYWEYKTFIVKFELYKTYQVYRLLDKDKKEIRSWKQDTMPNQLLEKMNLFIDEETDFILNLIDQELGQPFVTTSAQFDGRVFGFVAKNESLENAEKNLTEWLEMYQGAKMKEDYNVKHLNQLSSIYKYTDIDEFKLNIENKKRVLNTLSVFVDLYEIMESMFLSIGKDFTVANKKEIERIIKTQKYLRSTSEDIESFLLYKLRDFNYADKRVEQVIKSLEFFKWLSGSLEFFLSYSKLQHEFKLADKNKVNKYIESLEKLKYLNNKIVNLKNVIENEKVFSHADKHLVERFLCEVSKLKDIKIQLEKYRNNNVELMRVYKRYENVKNSRKEFERLYNFCPLCGQKFKEV